MDINCVWSASVGIALATVMALATARPMFVTTWVFALAVMFTSAVLTMMLQWYMSYIPKPLLIEEWTKKLSMALIMFSFVCVAGCGKKRKSKWYFLNFR